MAEGHYKGKGTNGKMYYLDLFTLYKPTNLQQRLIARDFDRNSEMLRKLQLQHFQCFFCGTAISMSDHLDHLVPVYYGGFFNKANLVASCRSCNLTKGTAQIEITNGRTIQDYLRLQAAHNKWQEKVKQHPRLKRFTPKKVRLYHVYHAELFKIV